MATIKNTADLQAQAAANLPDNTSQDISPQDVREMAENNAVSAYNKLTDEPIVGLKAYSASFIYELGTACTFGGSIYLANKTTTLGAFAPADWDVVGGGATNLTWTAATRTVASDTGTDAIISLFTSTEAGLVPLSGGVAGEYLEADGTWSVPSGANIYTTDGTFATTRTLTSGFNADFIINQTGASGTAGLTVRDGSSNFLVNGHGITLVNSATLLQNATSNVQLVLLNAGGVKINDALGGIGLYYNDYTVDEANVGAWGTEDNHIPSEARIIANVGSSITNDIIPIGNAGGTGIEDSPFQITTSADITKISGVGTEEIKNFVSFEQKLNINGPTESYQSTIFANGTGVSVAEDVDHSSGRADYIRQQLPNSSIHKVDVFNYGSMAQGTAASFHMTYGGIDYMGHTYGTDPDPRIVGAALGQNYTWLSDNDQHVSIGFTSGNTNSAGALGTQNAHLRIYSESTSPTPEPHLRFEGLYNTSVDGAPSNNTLWLDSVDSKLYYKTTEGTSVAIDDKMRAVINPTTPYAVGTYEVVTWDATAGNKTVNLPAVATSTNAMINVKKTDASGNTVTIDGNGAETIDGATTAVLTTQYEAITLFCDGIEWHIL